MHASLHARWKMGSVGLSRKAIRQKKTNGRTRAVKIVVRPFYFMEKREEGIKKSGPEFGPEKLRHEGLEPSTP